MPRNDPMLLMLFWTVLWSPGFKINIIGSKIINAKDTFIERLFGEWALEKNLGIKCVDTGILYIETFEKNLFLIEYLCALVTVLSLNKFN